MVDERESEVLVARQTMWLAAQQALCHDGGNHLKIFKDSMAFTVMPNEPRVLTVDAAMSQKTVEFEALALQPHVGVYDEFGNLVNRDCYRGTCGQAASKTSSCNTTAPAQCAVAVDLRLLSPAGVAIGTDGSSGNAVSAVTGKTLVYAYDGVARFTDIAIIADTSQNPAALTNCVCRGAVCDSCVAGEEDQSCLLPQPFPQYRFGFQARLEQSSELVLASTYADVLLERRTQSMVCALLLVLSSLCTSLLSLLACGVFLSVLPLAAVPPCLCHVFA